MLPILLIVGAVVLVVIALVVLRSRKPPEQLPSARADRELPERRTRDDKPAAEPARKPVAEAKPAARDAAPTPAAERAPEPARPAAESRPASIEVEAAAAQPEPTAPAAAPTPAPTEAAAPAPSAAAPAAAAPAKAAKRDVEALRRGLKQTRGGWVQRLVGLFRGKKEINPDLVAQIEETLLTGDVGVRATERLIGQLKQSLEGKDLENEDVVWQALHDVAGDVLGVSAPAFGAKAANSKPLVILVVGVNGVGKTTTIGKLASRYKDEGKKVVLAAGDTFRAAAVAQLEAWGRRVGVPVIKGKDASKPGAVVFDAVTAALKDGADVVIADTAGRLHTKTPLMDELRKVGDAANKALAGSPHEILLVLDATTGQNGITQVREFREALALSGIVLTKLDGTAKGGVILGICDEFKLPVRFIGVGEKVDDLREFDAEEFTSALFGRGGDDEVVAA